jgi:hypothetical protein
MKLGGIFVLVLGMALFPTCSAEVGPNDLWQFNSPIHFTTGVEVDMGITSTPGIDEGITLTEGIDKGITLTEGIDKGITLTEGIDKGFAINPIFAAKIGVS